MPAFRNANFAVLKHATTERFRERVPDARTYVIERKRRRVSQGVGDDDLPPVPEYARWDAATPLWDSGALWDA